MKKITLLLIFTLLLIQNSFAQGNSVANAEQFCAGGSELVFPNVTGEPNTTNVGCLGTIPNASYYYLSIDQPGDLTFIISQEDDLGNPIDVDFIAWGPFTSVAAADAAITLTDCTTCPNNTDDPAFYPYAPDYITDCSYSIQPTETLTINSAVSGEIYVVLITNYDGDSGNISIEQNGGMGTTNCGDLPVCGSVFYDSGGETGSYSNNETNTTTIYPYEAGGTVITTFTMFDVTSGDTLTVYDGPDVSASLLGTFSGTTTPGPFTSTHPTGTLTFVFTSNTAGVGTGWAADIVCNPPPPLSCGNTFTDSGGLGGNYSDGENQTNTIYPETPGDFVTVTFSSFNTESGFDELEVFDGPDASANSLGTFSGATTIPGPFTSTHASGALTFVFTSDSSVNNAGWEAEITCGNTCDLTIVETQNPTGADACNLLHSQLIANSTAGTNTSEIVFSENFNSATPGDTYPTGWTKTHHTENTKWIISNTNNAGGAANEAILDWFTGTNESGSWTLSSPSINIFGKTNLELNFKQYLNHFSNSYTYSIYIETSVDGGSWQTEYSVINVASSVGPLTQNIDLNSLSGNTLQVRFRMNGNPFGLNSWSIDDVLITASGIPTGPEITWSPTTGLYTDNSLTTPYTGGFTDTVYAAPNGTETYTATDQNSCTDTVTVTRNRIVWNGSVSTDWFTSNNWTPTGVPTNQNCVIIPDVNTTFNRSPVVASGTSSGLGKSLLVETNGYLELLPDAGLIITDDITVDGKFILRNTSSLVQITNTGITNTGNIQMQRTVNGLVPSDYVYWSSPVDNFTVTAVSPGSNQRYKWLPTTGAMYGNWQATSETMQPGTGYIIRGVSGTTPETTAAANTVEFTGVPRNGIIQVPITHGGYTGLDYTAAGNTDATELDDNWNLIGNPYPSAISADKFIAQNAGNLDATPDPNTPAIFGTVYLWRHLTAPASPVDPFYGDFVYNYSANDYIGYNGSGSNPVGFNGNIGSGQGFFVLMNDAAPVAGTNVVFNNDMRIDNSIVTQPTPYNNTQFYRGSANSNQNRLEKHRIWLDLVAPNNTANSILVGYISNATNDKDVLFDGVELSETSNRFYSLIDTEAMAIQGRALPFNDADTVPLGIEIAASGSYKIALNTLDGLFNSTDQTIYIEDTYTNIIHNVRTSPYVFNAEAGVFNNRFILRYTDRTLSVDQVNTQNGLIISAPKSNYIKVSSKNSNIKTVYVYDVLGRELIKKVNINAQKINIENAGFADGAYIVKAITANNTVRIEKVVLKRE